MLDVCVRTAEKEKGLLGGQVFWHSSRRSVLNTGISRGLSDLWKAIFVPNNCNARFFCFMWSWSALYFLRSWWVQSCETWIEKSLKHGSTERLVILKSVTNLNACSLVEKMTYDRGLPLDVWPSLWSLELDEIDMEIDWMASSSLVFSVARAEWEDSVDSMRPCTTMLNEHLSSWLT